MWVLLGICVPLGLLYAYFRLLRNDDNSQMIEGDTSRVNKLVRTSSKRQKNSA